MTTKEELLQAIRDYGMAKDAQGQAFVLPSVSFEDHRALCDRSAQLFDKIVRMLGTDETLADTWTRWGKEMTQWESSHDL